MNYSIESREKDRAANTTIWVKRTMKGACNVESFRQGCCLAYQPMQEANHCLTIIVDTLRRVNPSIISVGTLQHLQSNVLHIMSTLQYSRRSLYSMEPILAYLEQGQDYLGKIIEDVRRETSSYYLEQCVFSLAKAIEQWRSLIFVYPITLSIINA